MEVSNLLIKQTSSFLQSHWFALSISFALVYAYYYYETEYKYWSKRNLNGPKHMSLIGNIISTAFNNPYKIEREKVIKYGKVYGDIVRGQPYVVVADPEIIRQICIKDFDVFPNHGHLSLSNKYNHFFLVFLRDEYWKRVRTMMSPAFTSVKMKRMFRFLDGCADDLLANLGEQLKTGTEMIINMEDVYGLFTMDGISTCGYGLKMQRNNLEKTNELNSNTTTTREEFIHYSEVILQLRPARLLMVLFLPKFLLRLIGFEMQPGSWYEPMINRVRGLVKRRQNLAASKKYNDLLQLLVDAKLGDEMELSALDEAENHHAVLTKETLINNQKMLTDDVKSSSSSSEGMNGETQMSEIEILSEAIFLLAAGLETTRTLLTNVSYALAFHQQIQQQLYEELSKIVEYDTSEDGDKKKNKKKKKSPKFSYDALTSCQYLDAVISESLRAIPPVVQTDREASRDYYIEKYNVFIPKGGRIMLSLYAVQNDPDYWDEPEKFKPERFMPGNKEKIVPCSYVPFSAGPRHCVGMRFSLTEAKLGLAKVLMQYRIKPAPNTSYPPEPKPKVGVVLLKNPLVRLVARQ